MMGNVEIREKLTEMLDFYGLSEDVKLIVGYEFLSMPLKQTIAYTELNMPLLINATYKNLLFKEEFYDLNIELSIDNLVIVSALHEIGHVIALINDDYEDGKNAMRKYNFQKYSLQSRYRFLNMSERDFNFGYFSIDEEAHADQFMLSQLKYWIEGVKND